MGDNLSQKLWTKAEKTDDKINVIGDNTDVTLVQLLLTLNKFHLLY